MSTQEPENNELDGWFRKRMEEPELPFEPEAWAAMERKLDGYATQRTRFRKRWLLGLLLLFSITTAGIFWFGGKGQGSGTAASQSVTTESDSAGNAAAVLPSDTGAVNPSADATALIVPGPGGKVQEDQQPEQTPASEQRRRETQFEDDASLKEPATVRRSDAESRPAAGEKRPPHQVTQRMSAPQNWQERAEKERKTGSSGPVARVNAGRGNRYAGKTPDRAAPPLGRNQNAGEGAGPATAEGMLEKPTGEQFLVLAAVRSTEPQAVTVELGKVPPFVLPGSAVGTVERPGADSVLVRRKPAVLPTKLGLLALLAPDLTTVGFTNFTRPGSTFGLALEYYFNGRLSVLGGVLYSHKIYYASARDYTPPSPWTYQPDKIDGRCGMFDIPVNLRYVFAKTVRSALYLSAGFTSYIVKSEQYEYQYRGYPSRTWEDHQQDAHWLSTINLAAGYSRSLGGRLSWRVEPYLKLPTAGVGAGKVKLSSTGVFLGLQYNLVQSKKNN